MHPGAGVTLIAAGAAIALLFAFPLRERAGPAVVMALLAAAGLALGAGALLVQDRSAGAAEWTLTLAALAVATPVHSRVLLGPLGRRE